MTNIIELLDVIDVDIPKHLARFGQCTVYQLPNEGTLTCLPTCNTPLPHLVDANWDPKRSLDLGNFRRVRQIRALKNGTETNLYVKDPERIFNGSYQEGREIWWGGPKSGEKRIRINHQIVEQRVEIEAAILMELIRNGIRAEVPQAFISRNGNNSLIVNGVATMNGSPALSAGPTINEIRNKAIKIGLKPNDFGGHNALTDREGYIHVIDVNRWEWSPYTDYFHEKILRIFQESQFGK